MSGDVTHDDAVHPSPCCAAPMAFSSRFMGPSVRKNVWTCQECGQEFSPEQWDDDLPAPDYRE